MRINTPNNQLRIMSKMGLPVGEKQESLIEDQNTIRRIIRKLTIATVLEGKAVVGIAGLQGSGKTTLVRGLYGLDENVLVPTSGRGERLPILIAEDDIQSLEASRMVLELHVPRPRRRGAAPFPALRLLPDFEGKDDEHEALILQLAGVAEEHMKRVYGLIRGGAKPGRSSTSHAFLYQRSEDDCFHLWTQAGVAAERKNSARLEQYARLAAATVVVCSLYQIQSMSSLRVPADEDYWWENQEKVLAIIQLVH